MLASSLGAPAVLPVALLTAVYSNSRSPNCSYVPNPVLVIIDVQPKELGIPTKAYYAVEEVKEVHNLLSCWSISLACSVFNLFFPLQNATQKSQKVFVHVPSEIATVCNYVYGLLKFMCYFSVES